jgi:uncharacterized protein (TIGR00297 family)
MVSLSTYFIDMVILAVIINFPLLFIIIYKKFLRLDGIIAAGITAVLLFIIHPAFWITLCVFFFSSSVLSIWKTEKKKDISINFEKTSQRDALQVLSNDIVPLSFGMLYFMQVILPKLAIENNVFSITTDPTSTYFITVFVAFAVHTADTWATEIGILSKKTPRSIINPFKTVSPGTSGGITILGSIASLLGSGLIALCYIILGIAFSSHVDIIRLLANGLLILISGFLGAMIDSLEGMTIQGIYFCEICQKETEKNPHRRCGNHTYLKRGFKIVNNDIVNLSSALIANFFVIALFS